MVKPVSREISAAAPAVDAPAKTKGRLIEPFKINPNYKLTRSVFNTELKSSNQAARGLEKTAYAVAAFFVGIAQTLHNILIEVIAKGFVDMVVILPVNGVHSFLKKEKAQPVEVEMAPVATPTAPAAEEARRLEEQPVAPKAETPAQQPASKGIRGRLARGLQTMKDNPGKTMLAVATVATLATLYFNPAIVTTISSTLARAASSLGLGGGYAGNYAGYAGNYAGNYAGYAGNYAGSYAGYAGSVVA